VLAATYSARLRRRQVPLAAPARRVATLPLRYRLVAVGLVGLGLTLFVLQSAVSSFSAESRARASASRIGWAERYHQDADQAHDALHADVLDALRVGRAGDRTRDSDALAVLESDSTVFRTNLNKVAALHLGGSLGRALASLRPAQLDYATDGERLGRLAVVDPAAADTQLVGFDEAFLRLVRAQGAVTSKLARSVDTARTRADAIQRSAERRIITACLIAMGVLVLLSVVLARLGERLSRAVKRERGVAETLARSMLPDTLPQLPGLAMSARYLPTGQGNQIGGDWYDVLLLAEGKLAVMMGDVVGHDIAAAAVMGQLRIAGRAYALEGMAPAEVMGRLNTLLLSLDRAPMATCLYLQIELLTGEVTAAGAGHPWPLVIAGSTATVAEMPPGPPLGALPEARYVQRMIETPPGSTLLLYTDGLIERRGESLDTGLERLIAAATRQVDDPGQGPDGSVDWVARDPDRLCEALISEFFSAREPIDDVALLAMHFAANQAAPMTLHYAASPEVLPDLRHTLGRWLHAVGADHDERFALTVAVAEAASNAIEHAYGPLNIASFIVTCALRQDTVEVTVEDNGHWRPPRGVDRGNGQRLIASLTDDMRVDPTSTGTIVAMSKRLAHLAPPSKVAGRLPVQRSLDGRI
jgi:serine phosphatase RsbU (regulator of sigma subunit)/anti-sigma regulatory factor (Ser/Thr protein kinase)